MNIVHYIHLMGRRVILRANEELGLMNRKDFGTKFDDTFWGTSDDDIFYGLEGDDRFFGSAGADTYIGGDGIDTADYRYAGSGVKLSLEKGGSKGDAAGDTYFEIENVIGSKFADSLSGNGFDNVLNGRGGDDFLYGANGDDSLLGGEGNDRLYGEGDDDSLRGGDGDDLLSGGSGDDVLEGDAGADVIDGGSDVDGDTLSYYNSNAGVSINLETGSASGGHATGDTFRSVENVTGSYFYGDHLVGDAGNNVLDGLRGNDVFVASAGYDTIIGGVGMDTIDYSHLSNGITVHSGDVINKGELGSDKVSGTETVVGTSFKDTFYSRSGDDFYFGGAGDDVFLGGSGSDYFLGGSGTDTVRYFGVSEAVRVDLETGFGGGGAAGDRYVSIENAFGTSHNDTFIGTDADNHFVGQGGDDAMYGRAGNDTFDIQYGRNAAEGGGGFDTVIFRGDWIDLAEGLTSKGDNLVGIEAVRGHGDGAQYFGDYKDNRFDVRGSDNLVEGRDGDDTFVVQTYNTVEFPSYGGNAFDGGAGVDTFEFNFVPSVHLQDSTEGAEIDLEAGLARHLAPVEADNHSLVNIENASGTDWGDLLFGDDGANVLTGNAGDDHINGRGGDDILIGGEGEDVFEFRHFDFGESDHITDFEVENDRIDLGNTEVDNWADLVGVDAADDGDYAEQVGNNVIIHSSDEDMITLWNTELAALTPDNFLF